MSRSRSRRKTGTRQPAPNNPDSLFTAPEDFGGPIRTVDDLKAPSLYEMQQKTIDATLGIIDKLTNREQTPPPPKWARWLGYGYTLAIVALTLIALSYFLHGRYPESTASEDLAKIAVSALFALVVGMAKGSLPGSK